MVPIAHAGHPIETKTVKMELFEPILKIGQQEGYGFLFAIVEAAGIPYRMLATLTAMKIKSFRTIEAAQTFFLIGNRMRMYHIQNHENAHTMSSINQFHQLFGSTETERGSKQIGHLIAKRAIIRMFLNGHQLYCIVTQIFNPRQHIFLELPIGRDFLLFGRHAHMCLIN